MEEIRLLFSDLIGWLSRIGIGSIFTLVVTLGVLSYWRKKDNTKEEIHRLDTKIENNTGETRKEVREDIREVRKLLYNNLLTLTDKVAELRGQIQSQPTNG